MKALFFDEPEKPVVTQVQSPTITENEVMIRSRRVGICHSDYELLAGQYIIPISYPVIPGHEWVGEVVEVGKNVTGLKPSDRVVGECVINTPERVHHFGFSMNGANREYFAARPEWLHKLPDSVDDAKGALIEPFTCGFYAVLRNGAPNAADTVVVSGGGTIGLVSAAAAIGMRARVIVVDPVPLRRDIAKRLGAEATVDPSAGDPVEAVLDLTQGGADLVIEASGHSASLANVFEYARQDGRVSMVGINIGHKIPVELGKISDEEPHRARLHRFPGRMAGRNSLPRADGRRSLSDSDPQFPARRRCEGARPGERADEAVKVTLEIA